MDDPDETNYASCNSLRNSADSLRLPSICARGPDPFCTSVKALKSDQAVRARNASCRGSSRASMTFAVEVLEGDDAAVDGITGGAGLGPSVGHADQVRSEEVFDVTSVGTADGSLRRVSRGNPAIARIRANVRPGNWNRLSSRLGR